MYLLLKSLHIISFVAWMAGLLYLPRLFVYHCGEKYDSNIYKKFLLMEKRLLNFIMTPALIATWFFGVCLYVINIDAEQNIFVEDFIKAIKSVSPKLKINEISNLTSLDDSLVDDNIYLITELGKLNYKTANILKKRLDIFNKKIAGIFLIN